jgi:anti-anti-sigma factor
MAFQFKRDRGENITLTLAGDIDLEVTPEIKNQLASQTEDAASLTIDGTNISYLDSSGVSILIIAMQTCKQKKITFKISAISEEAMRVLRLAKLDKILPVENVSGPADLVDIDVFSKTGDGDTTIAQEIAAPAPVEEAAPPSSADDDLIAAIASGDMSSGPSAPAAAPSEPEAAPAPPAEEAAEEAAEETAEDAPEAAYQAAAEKPRETEMASAPAPAPTSKPAPPASDKGGQGGNSGGGGGFTPGTFG